MYFFYIIFPITSCQKKSLKRLNVIFDAELLFCFFILLFKLFNEELKRHLNFFINQQFFSPFLFLFIIMDLQH